MGWRGGGPYGSVFQTGLPSRRGIRGLSSSAVRNRITGWAAMAGHGGRADENGELMKRQKLGGLKRDVEKIGRVYAGLDNREAYIRQLVSRRDRM